MFIKSPFRSYTQRGALNPAPAGGGGTWTAVLTVTPNAPGNDGGNNGYTFVTVIPLSAFSATGGTKIRITASGAATGTEGSVFSGLWIGNGGGGNAYAFTGDQVQMKQAGGNTITLALNTPTLLDEANFVKDGANPLVIAMQLQDAANDSIWKQGGANPGGGYSSWYKSGADASTQAKTGYSDNSASSWLLLVTKIELYN